MFFKRRFYFTHAQLPTQFNLAKHLKAAGWRQSAFRAGFSDKQLEFAEIVSQTLEFKHLLAEFTARHCPNAMPKTLVIDEANWPCVLALLESTWQPSTQWILKPSLLNNGQHIHLFSDLASLERHFAGHQRMGGLHVLQRYIANPHLLRSQRKYSIRMFVVLTNYDGAFLYPEGYFNVATHPYTPNQLSDLSPHLTNEHLHGQEANVIQIPASRFEWFSALKPQMTAILNDLFQAISQEFTELLHHAECRQIALFGMDFLPEDNGRVWLLEANHGPCFPVDDSHPLQSYVYADFWRAVVKEFVEPIAQKRSVSRLQYSEFSRISGL